MAFAAKRPRHNRAWRAAHVWLILGIMVAGGCAVAASLVWQGEQAAARQREANHWYAHSLEVLVEVERASTALSEIQRGARGYLLTGDRRFLQSYEAGLQAAPYQLTRVKLLTVDNPSQERRLAVLAAASDSVIGLSRREVELETSGRHAEAIALVRSRMPSAAIERSRLAATAIEEEEQRLLKARGATTEQANASATHVTVALAIFGAALLVAATGLGWIAFAAASRARLAEVSARANEEMASSSALLSLFISEAPAAIAMFDREMRYLAVSRRFVVDYQLSPDIELVGRSHYEIFPEIPQRWKDIHASVLAGETRSCDEDPFPRDGHTDWIRWRMQPWRDANGEIGGALLFSEVMTAQVEAHRARLAAEVRLRAIVETAAEAIVVIDELGIIQSANPATEALFGYRIDEMLGRNVSLLMPEPYRSSHDDHLARYRRTGRRKIIGVGREVECVRKDGSIAPIDLAVAEWRDDEHRYFTGLMRDISARKLAEAQRMEAERRELVVGELRHRLNNMFAVIQSFVVTTARTQDDIATYRNALAARIKAFAATQVELARKGWSSMSLRELVAFELKPYAEAERSVSIDGEDLNLDAGAAESMAMIIHELATNAAKYGGLSSRDAILSIRWSVSPDKSGEPRLLFHWVESGGPQVTAPQRRGFGSTLIERSARALGGSADLGYAPEGLTCTLNLPAPHVLAPTSSTAEAIS